MKKLIRSRYVWLASLITVILGSSLLMAQVFDAAKLEETFDGALLNEYKSHEVSTLAELAQDFEYQQAQWLPIAPPSTEFWGWTQTASPAPMPFNPGGFPKEFVAGLVPAYRDGVTVYPVTVWEDPKTRDRVFFNAESKEIGSIPAPQGYDPRWSLLAIYPNLSTRSWTTDYINILALIFEPSHLLIRYDLILEDDLVKWVLVQSIRASLRAQAGTGGGPMMMKWQGGTVTNIQFVDIQKDTNGCMTVTLAYPEQYQTNANTGFEFFTCDGGRGLLDSWWDLGITTNVNTSTNWILWIDKESSNAYASVRFYAVSVSNDADGDGFTDGFEKYLCHTDPTNVNSRPFSVSGAISYTGSLTGPIRMIAVTSSNSWVGCMATMASLGAYTNAKVASGTNYWFKAYRDCNSNKIREYGEPWGIYTNVSILVTNNLTGINITLTEDTDEDNDGLVDWWELQYFGSIWTQDADDDSDNDTIVNSNEFTYGTNPAKADTDSDGLNDYSEIFTYNTSATNADTDYDNMGDGAEIINGQQPTVSNSFYQLAFQEEFETNTVGTNYLHGMNGWLVSPTNQVILKTNEVHAGQQSGEVGISTESVSVSHLFGAHDKTNTWIDFWARVDPATITHLETTPDITAITNRTPTVFAVNRYGGIALYDANPAGATWVVASNCIPELAESFHRFTVNQDFVGRTWAFYFDGALIASNLHLRGNIYEFHNFSYRGTQAGATYLDALSIGTTKPAGLSE
jgi:hypothetical protein